MPSVIKSNTQAFLAYNQESRAQFLTETKRGLDRLELLFISDIQQKQMSGRHGSTGTNVVTGMLRRQWFQQTIQENNTIQALVWSTTPYAPAHELQEGPVHVEAQARTSKLGRPFTVRAHWSLYKKRLRIEEAFNQDFRPAMAKVINQAAAKYLR